MADVKILSADGLTELAEQEVSETRNLFFGSPSAPAVDNMDVSPTNVFADDKADNAYLWVDGMETVATLPVAEADSGGGQSVTPSLPDSVVSQKIEEVVELDSVLVFSPTSQVISPSNPSVVLRNTEDIDGKETAMPFLRIGTMEVAINGTKLRSGASTDNKKITAANYADGSRFVMELSKNLPSSKMLDVVKAFYEPRGAEVNVAQGGNVTINPFASVIASWAKSYSGTIVTLSITPADKMEGESYFLSFKANYRIPDNTVNIACVREDGTALYFTRYLEKVDTELNGGVTSKGPKYYTRLTFPDAVHSFKTLKVSKTYTETGTPYSQTFSDVMLSRSDVLTPYSSEKIETDEQRELLASLDVSLTYPFATAIAGDTVLWRSWKLGATNTPAKTVTANYSTSGGAPVLSVVKSNTGGNDTSAISIPVNGMATTGHYLDDKGKPLTGLFFSSRKDLQTSAGFLAKWLFAACARKLTITRPRGGMFGEAQEEQGNSATNYYMFAPPEQPLNGTSINVPCAKNSRALVVWRTALPQLSADKFLYDITFDYRTFLGFRWVRVNFLEFKPAHKMHYFAHVNGGETWFTFPNGGNGSPVLSAKYKDMFASHTIVSGAYSVNLLGFTRTRYYFSNSEPVKGLYPETVTLRRDAPCPIVETWMNKSGARLDVLYKGSHYGFYSLNQDTGLMFAYIVSFKSGIEAITHADYGRLRIINVPDDVSSIEIGYFFETENGMTADLYYYQLNEN